MLESVRILVIEDNIQDFLILKEYIRRTDSFEVEIEYANNLESARLALLEDKFDLIFLDLFLPDAHGRESFVNLYGIAADVPIIVLSGLADRQIALEIVQLGAQDYIVKGEFDELLIEKAIIYSIERHKNQKKLQKSEERHRITVENAGVGLAEYNAQYIADYVRQKKAEGVGMDFLDQLSYEDLLAIRGNIKTVSMNPALYQMFECSSVSEFIQTHQSHHTENSLELMRNLVKCIWKSENQLKAISRYLLKSGKEIILLNRFTFFELDDGNCKFVRSATDVTTLKAKESQIEFQHNLAENLSEASIALLGKGTRTEQLEKAFDLNSKSFSSDLISIVKLDQKEDQNFFRLYYEWQGTRRPEGIDNSWVYGTSLQKLGLDELTEHLESGELLIFDVNTQQNIAESLIKFLEKCGIKSIVAAPIFSNKGLWGMNLYINFFEEKIWSSEELISVKSFTSALGSFLVRDRAERELQKLNEELEDIVEKRTEELTETMEELESFSYSVSHDLRAPLRKVGGFSQILDKEFGGELPERASHLLNNIKDGATEMSHLIHDLLEFSRLGRQSLSLMRIDMNALCSEVIEDAHATYPNLNVNVKVHDLKEAHADRTLVKHVLNNLIWNAIKFSSTREIIEIEIYCRTEHNKCVYSVKDNGIGIDMEYAHKVFSVFQRLHTQDEYEGTGVGLAIVKRIVRKHGGSVSVDGKLDKGCTFSFSLPSYNQALKQDLEAINIPVVKPSLVQ